jgi:BlaI family penicillinase repressor
MTESSDIMSNIEGEMARPPQDVTESELAVLRVLWELGKATIRQLTDRLHPQGGPAQYATVQKLLERMESKGYVERDRSMFVHIFSARMDRDGLIGQRLRGLVESLCEGSMTPLLTHLARVQDLSEEERRALRAIIDQGEEREVDRASGRGQGVRRSRNRA